MARHHLDKLAAGGYVDVAVERHDRPGAGRPSKRYRVTAKDMGLEFPARRDDLLVTLLGRMLELVPPDQAEGMAEEVGYGYGRSLASSMAPGEGHRSFQAALHAVADALTATASRPTPRLVPDRWRSSPSTVRSGTRPCSTRSSAPSTGASSGACWPASTARPSPTPTPPDPRATRSA